MERKQLNIMLFPWLAMGHIIPYFELGLKFADRGHIVTLFLPNKAKLKLPSTNIHPLLTLHTITIPHVHPLPPGTQLNSEIPFHLATALDHIHQNLIFYDFAYWVPAVVGSQAKCVTYFPISAVAIAYLNVPFRDPPKGRPVVDDDPCVARPPPGYPSSTVVLQPKDILVLFLYMPYGDGITFHQRIVNVIKGSDAMAIRTIRETEGKYCDYLSSQYNNKPVLCPGVVLTSEPHNEATLDNRWADFLARFGPESVIFCSFGSQVKLDLARFQELLLGFDMTNLPFIVVLKLPTGWTTVEEGFPEGFAERVGDRGVVTGEWVPQPQIVAHQSIGCFVNHCGSGSIWEALLSKNQIVLIPQLQDQILFRKILAKEMKVAVEVERGEDGKWVAKESLCKSINSVMNEYDEIGKLVKANHEFWRQKVAKPKPICDFFDNFVKDLETLHDD